VLDVDRSDRGAGGLMSLALRVASVEDGANAS